MLRMKTKLCLVFIAVVLVLPMSAFATPIGTVNMQIGYTSPNINVNGTTYYGDYDATLKTDISGIFANGFEHEVFCTENAELKDNPTDYDIYKIAGINGSLAQGSTIDLQAILTEATWYANWFLNVSNQSDAAKGTAQLAIWNAIGWANSTNPLANEYASATDKDAYINDWYLAVSPANDGPIEIGQVGQNYLVKASPVPEPATMVLLGFGILGMAGVRRKQKQL